MEHFVILFKSKNTFEKHLINIKYVSVYIYNINSQMHTLLYFSYKHDMQHAIIIKSKKPYQLLHIACALLNKSINCFNRFLNKYLFVIYFFRCLLIKKYMGINIVEV